MMRGARDQCQGLTTRPGRHVMAGRGSGPDFVEALARGLDVLSCFDERHPRMTLTQIAVAADLAPPTARPRGALAVLPCSDERPPGMPRTQIAVAAVLARPTARRLVLTLQELGYIRSDGGSFTLTPRVLRLGTSYVDR